MKKLKYIALMLLSPLIGSNVCKTNMEREKPKTSVYDISAVTIEGDTIRIEQYKGKMMLIVNVASKCGYTPQYDELQKFHEKYKDKVSVIGFPCNQFGGQEPGTHEEIVEFCRLNYGVTFQLFEKVNVKGTDQHPLYQWLSDPQQNGWNDQHPGWNFCKYLVSEEGELLGFYKSGVKPLSEEITKHIN